MALPRRLVCFLLVASCVPACKRQDAPPEPVAPASAVAQEPVGTLAQPGDVPATAQATRPEQDEAPTGHTATVSDAEPNPAGMPLTVPDCDAGDLQVRRENHPNGQHSKEYQVRIGANGVEIMHGYYRSWHDNGKPYLEGQYVDGQRHGLWLTWHKTGGRRGEGTLNMGQKHGTWVMWDPNGNETDRSEWVNGTEQQ